MYFGSTKAWEGFFDGIKLLFIIACVIVPLALWKLFDLIWPIIQHIHWI